MSQEIKNFTESKTNKENKKNNEFIFNEHETPTLKLYLKAIEKTQPLSTEEEQELGRRSMQGDIAARNKLIEANQKYAVKCVVDFHNTKVPTEELISAARQGLVEAATRFDPEFGFRFTTYAAHYIKEYIRQAAAEYYATIHMPLKALKAASRKAPSVNDDADYTEMLDKEWPVIYSDKKSTVVCMPSYHSLSDCEGMSDDSRPLVEKVSGAPDAATLERVLNKYDDDLRAFLSAYFCQAEVDKLMNYAYKIVDGYTIADLAHEYRLPYSRMKKSVEELLAKVQLLELSKVFHTQIN